MPTEKVISPPESSPHYAETPLKRDPLQAPNLRDHFNARAGSSKNSRDLEALRAAQRIQDSERSPEGTRFFNYRDATVTRSSTA
jgi:hypothetical protein